MNSVILSGRIGQTPELKYTKNGIANLSFSLAVSENWVNSEGEKQESTSWVRCVLWKKRAESLAKYLDKGSKIVVNGKLSVRTWDKEDGTKGKITEVVVKELDFFSNRVRENRYEDNAPSTPNLDDISF